MSELQLKQVEYVLGPNGYEPRTQAPETIRGVHAPKLIDREDIHKRLVEGNDTYQVTSDRRGMKHESVLFNADKIHEGLVRKPTTPFSGALKNPGNVLETAVLAAMYPGIAIELSSSEGNYPTGHMSSTDRAYRRKTGRLTRGDGSADNPFQPSDSIRYEAEMIEEQGRAPTDFYADQDAGRIALALMAALSPDTVKSAYLNGIGGISPAASYVSAHVVEDMQSRAHRRSIGEGKPGELTPFNVKEVKRAMPNIYGGLKTMAHIAPFTAFFFLPDTRDMIGKIIGYKGHNNLDDLKDHAVFQDMSAALRQQKSMITLQFNQGSHQHNLDDCGVFSQAVMNHIPEEIRDPHRGVHMLLGVGNWKKNTDEPYEAGRMLQLGIPGLKHEMRALSAARILDPQVLALSSIARARAA